MGQKKLAAKRTSNYKQAGKARVWWPPTTSNEKTDLSGAYWPAAIINRSRKGVIVQYDNGEIECVNSEHVMPADLPVEFGKETVEIKVGEFVEVHNNSMTDPAAWVGVVERIENGNFVVHYPFHDAEVEIVKATHIRRARVWEKNKWMLIKPYQTWSDGEVTSPLELERILEKEIDSYLNTAKEFVKKEPELQDEPVAAVAVIEMSPPPAAIIEHLINEEPQQPTQDKRKSVSSRPESELKRHREAVDSATESGPMIIVDDQCQPTLEQCPATASSPVVHLHQPQQPIEHSPTTVSSPVVHLQQPLESQPVQPISLGARVQMAPGPSHMPVVSHLPPGTQLILLPSHQSIATPLMLSQFGFGLRGDSHHPSMHHAGSGRFSVMQHTEREATASERMGAAEMRKEAREQTKQASSNSLPYAVDTVDFVLNSLDLKGMKQLLKDKGYSNLAYLMLLDVWRRDSPRLADALRSYRANVDGVKRPDWEAFMVAIFGLEHMRACKDVETNSGDSGDLRNGNHLTSVTYRVHAW